MALGEEHVPESQGFGLGLEVLKNLGVALPSLVADTDQGLEDSIGSGKRQTVLESSMGRSDVCIGGSYGIQSSSTNLATTSSVFFAFSLTRSRTC